MFLSNQHNKIMARVLAEMRVPTWKVETEEQEDSPARLSCFDAQLVPFQLNGKTSYLAKD